MTLTEQVVNAVKLHPGKTPGELAEITGYNDKQVATAVVTALKRGFITRKRRPNSVRNPNVGLWEYHP